MKRWIAAVVLLLSGCADFAANLGSTPSVSETIAKDRYGRYLSLNAAIQAYLGGVDDYLEVSWNIAPGYRLYTDMTTVADNAGPLTCEWTGMLATEHVPNFGPTTAARIFATTTCKRRSPRLPLATISIRHVGGAADGHLLPPGELRLVRKDAIPKYYSGLVISDITPELMGVEPVFAYGGVLVHATEPGSSSERSGLRRGDIITTVNGLPVRNARQFLDQFQSDQHQGHELELDVYRVDGRFKRVRVVLRRELSADRPTGIGVSEQSR